MDKEPKAMNYFINVVKTVPLSEVIRDGQTERKAKELGGTWVKLNPELFAIVDEKTTTVVKIGEDGVGCACDDFTSATTPLMCKELIAFENLKNDPKVSIQSTEYRWLQVYLFSKGWYSDEDRWLYPSLDAPTVEPEVVAELPAVEESAKLDPMNENKPLDTGVDEEPKNKSSANDVTMVHYVCPKCGEIVDVEPDKLNDWKLNHIDVCTGKKADKQKSPRLVTQEAPEQPQDEVVKESLTTEKMTGSKTETVEKPPKEDKTVKPSTAVAKPEPRTPMVKKEMLSDAEFQTAAVGRILKNQGSIYKISGKEVADSAAVSNYAVSAGVSTETTVLEQTAEYARATVRAYKGGRYTEGSVLLRKDAILEKIMIDLAEKNPSWIIGWSNGLPEFDLDQKVYIGDKQKILGLHIAGTLIDAWTFAARNCETKARRRAQIQMLGADWREDDEVESEVEEMNTVAKR